MRLTATPVQPAPQEILESFDISEFPKLTKDMIKKIDDVLSVDIPNLVKQFDNPYADA